MRARIASMLPEEGPVAEVLQQVARYSKAGLRRGAGLVAQVRDRIGSKEVESGERDVAEQVTERAEAPVREEVIPEQVEQTPVQREEQPVARQEETERPIEQRREPAPSPQARGARIPVATVPMQDVELPPVVPSAGPALSLFYSLAAESDVDLESLLMLGDAVRMEVAGSPEDISVHRTRR